MSVETLSQKAKEALEKQLTLALDAPGFNASAIKGCIDYLKSVGDPDFVAEDKSKPESEKDKLLSTLTVDELKSLIDKMKTKNG